MNANRPKPLMILLFVFVFLQAKSDSKTQLVLNPGEEELFVSESAINSCSELNAILYISLSGNDSNPGTKALPFKSFEAAINASRDVKSDFKKIVVLPGDYFISKTIELNIKDNGLVVEAEQAGTVNIYGGQKLTNWKQGDNGFWYAELPEVKEGKWDFRALLVNSRLAKRARFPETGTFLHEQVWDVKVLPAVAGYWERQPLPEEKLIMAYNPKDLPDTLDIKNAEVRVYHMWDESLVGLSKNDTTKHVFTFSNPATFPPGAFGVKKYVVFNTIEGMSHPGQWYLDRTRGRVVYWPLKDENMANASVIAPRIKTVIQIKGEKGNPAKNIMLRNLSIQATNIPMKSAGWGGASFDGAVDISFADNCKFENLEVCNIAGLGISALGTSKGTFLGCKIHHTGACGFKFRGEESIIKENCIHNVGLFFPSSSAFYSIGSNMNIYRNQIYNVPYSGMILSGRNNRIEENIISRVMQELHDGAAIYTSGTRVKNCILRGNVVRDIVQVGQGFGVSSYYFDEGASNCLVENNVSIGVARPTHNHIASAIIYRDNTFIAEGDMALSFQRSANCVFEGNTLIAPGQIKISQPNGIKSWKNNVVYRGQNNNDNPLEFTIDSAMPPYQLPDRMKEAAMAVKVSKSPVLDGELGMEEWPGKFHTLNRETSRLTASGAPVMVKLSYDKKFLYIGAIVTMFDPEKISKGNAWKKDDGLELAIAGKTKSGEPTTFIIRLFAGDILQCFGNDETPNKHSAQLEKSIRYKLVVKSKKSRGKGWCAEMAVPLNLLGIRAEPGMKVPFNLCAFCNEYGNWHCWEGTQSDSWNLEQAGYLMFDK